MTDVRNKTEQAAAGCPAGYGENDWIDFLMDKFGPVRAEKLRLHLRECGVCAAVHEEWSALLPTEGGSKERSVPLAVEGGDKASVLPETEGDSKECSTPLAAEGGGKPSALLEAEGDGKERSALLTAEAGNGERPPAVKIGETRGGKIGEGEYPRESVYRSLARQVRLMGWRRRMRRRWAAGALSVAAACLLLVALRLGGGNIGEPPAPIDDYVQLQEPAALAVLSAPDTSRYRIVAPVGGEGAGYFWLSGDSSEAFLLLERLPALELADYQAWAVSGSRRDSLGLMKLTGMRGHLYVRADALRMADTIALSAEPKGGSLQPTTEQIILLLLGRN